MTSPLTPSPFTLHLINWFRDNGRDLPWRRTRHPYAIWLSEIILQQTQVKQGWDYWERFMRRWPTVESLAAATEDEVLREWQGLGYYSRARNLHYAARQIVQMGGFPNTIEGLRQLKGVGDYTAAAIGSIAFGLPAAVVDGNVYRVLSRHFGIATPINTTEGKKEFAMLAQSLLPPTSHLVTSHPATSHPPTTPDGSPPGLSPSSLYNQAIMDFGAIQCTPQSPRCDQCPLQETCVAYREGRIAELPVKLKTLKVKERHLTYIYVRYQGQTAIHRRGEHDIWQGLYEPILIDNSPLDRRTLATGGTQELTIDNWAAQNNLHPSVFNLQLLAKNVKHILTHRVLLADFYLWEPAERPVLPDGYFWVDESRLDDYAKPRLIELLFDKKW
ncbi:MAG: A/G-specific adenine glycosylase [Prevotella sp.]|nr:A/G-specific adenine glycosylase [Prevotella sp.]